MTLLPMSVQELCESVRSSRAFDRSRLDRVLGVDTGRALVEVQAAVTWKTLAAQLRPGDSRAQALRTARATIGDSIAWNAAGPDGRPTVTHVEALTMVTPDGQLRRLNRLANPALFALAVGGQHLFGVMYSVTLRIDSLARAVSEAAAVLTLLKEKDAFTARRSLRLLVPPEQAPALLEEARERCARWRIPLSCVELRPIRCETETFLRWARRDYAELSLRMGRSSTLGSAVRTTQLTRELIDAAIARGGTFPIACTPDATRDQTRACYPELASFLAEHHRLDPGDRMANAWLRHHRSLLTRQDCEVRFGDHAEP